MLPARAASLLAGLLLLTGVAAAQPGSPGAQDSPPQPALTIAELADGSGVVVTAPGYTAVVDLRHGNLRQLANAAGAVLLGGGPIDGVAVEWGGAVFQPGGGPVTSVTWTAEPPVVTARHGAFELVYSFTVAEVLVRLVPTDAATLAQPVTLRAASIEEPSREAAVRFSAPAYTELAGYPTDYWTDSSSGQFGLWTTAVYSVGGHTYRAAMLRPAMDGLCRWETVLGQVAFDHADGHSAGAETGSPLYRESCGLSNSAADLEAAGTVVVPALHQVVQTFSGLTGGATLSFRLLVTDRGYSVSEVLYPVSTRHTAGANTGLTSAKVVEPWHKPEGGFPLVVYMPGHWDELYTHSYLWDFLANHGYLVVVPFTTADMGDGHQRDDWGYMSQTEADELRLWAMRNYDIDEDRVYTVGLSLGGLNTLLNALNHPDAYAATVYYSGVYDFVRFWATPLGAASFPLNVEAALCCGDPVQNPYEYAIRNPRERIAQFQGDLFIVQGDADAVAPPDHAIELSTAVPGSVLHIGQGAHENNVFAGFRKEALAFLDSQEPRPRAQRDQVDLRVYGHPDLMPFGFERPTERRNYTTEWMTVWVEDGAFTHVQGQQEVIEEGQAGRVTVQTDRPATASIPLPGWCVPRCLRVHGDHSSEELNATVRAIALELAPGAPQGVQFQRADAPVVLPPDPKESPGPGPAAVIVLAILALVTAAWRRRA